MATSSLHRASHSDEHVASAPPLCIGMPVYNGEAFVAAALESLVNQSFGDLQIVISDNASTDGTEEICRDFERADKRIHYIRQERNRGGNWNFNYVFEHCRSPYFSWAAHDDLRAPTYYERCLDVLEERPEVAWCHSRSGAVDAVGQRLESSPRHACWAAEPEVIDAANGHAGNLGRMSRRPSERFRGVLMGRSYCLDVFGVIRANVLRDTRGLLSFIHSDKVLVLELATRGEYFEIPEELFLVRLHDAQATELRTSIERAKWNGRTMVEFSGYLRRLLAYTGAATTSPMPLTSKIAALTSLVPYTLQLRKLPRVLREMCRVG